MPKNQNIGKIVSKDVDDRKEPKRKRSKIFDNREFESVSNQNQEELLFEAVKNENAKEVKNLLEINKEKTADFIDKRGKEKITSLHLAVSKNNIEITKLLLENGAKPEMKSDVGKNSFHYVQGDRNLELLELLEKYTDDIEKTLNNHDESGWSVLHSAASAVAKNEKNWPMIEWLLERGANPNYKVNNRFMKDYSVEKVISQNDDTTYGERYLKIVEDFNKRKGLLEKKRKDKNFFQRVIKGDDEKIISELNPSVKKKREEYLKIEKEIAELKRQLRLAEEQIKLQEEILIEELKISEREGKLVTSIQVPPKTF